MLRPTYEMKVITKMIFCNLLLRRVFITTFAKKLDFSFVTFLIGFVVGPQFELSLRQAIAVTPNFENLLNHPIAIIFTLLTILAMWKIGAAKKKIQ